VTDWGPLERGIDGSVALPGSPAYETRHRPFNARFHELEPEAIVSCANPHDVAETLAYVRRHGLALGVRAGGHSFAGLSTTIGALVDVGPMRSVSVSGGLVTVGAGATLGEVYEALGEHGLAIPGGTCPPVGVCGLTLGGGLGILGRTYGVLSDSLAAAEIVLADGRQVVCDDGHEEELFWALRGAGSRQLRRRHLARLPARAGAGSREPASLVAVLGRDLGHRGLADVGAGRTRRTGREPQGDRDGRRRASVGRHLRGAARWGEGRRGDSSMSS
jgi:FAD/FMN-containing dehydrogenase